MENLMKASRIAAIALVLGTLACDDLDVVNPNNPSRQTVITSSQDVLALISNGMLQWFNRSGSTSPGVALSVMADEFTTGFADFGGQDLSKEPREAVNNSPSFANGPPHHVTFTDYYANIAALNQALQAMKAGNLTLRNSAGVDVTTEAHAYAKFMQGLNHGYAALMMDKSYVFSETVDTDTLRFTGGNEGVQKLIRPYTEVMDTALAELNAALQLANSKTFSYPSSVPNQWFLGVPVNNTELARMIHTFIARFMVYNARTPAQRQAVNWNAVIQHIDQGITKDLVVMGTVGVVESSFKNRAARLRTVTPGDFMRVDYRVVGPADQGPGYMAWSAQPFATRTPFRMTNVQDRRIDGLATKPATCVAGTGAVTSCGLYMGYHNATIFAVDRGLGQRSFYWFHRYGGGTSYQSGPIPIINLAEMDLLKAEGLIRLNRAAEAVTLINKYRVTNGQLPAVTVDGVPGTVPNCTPRKLSGECGSLWDALRYEKRIETMGLEGGPAWYDGRGWDALVQGTPIHFPIPNRDAELLNLELYTFGGTGAGAAPAANPEKCPVSLPRC
jgi:hypothetical protein